jgi:hypothetical protein
LEEAPDAFADFVLEVLVVPVMRNSLVASDSIENVLNWWETWSMCFRAPRRAWAPDEVPQRGRAFAVILCTLVWGCDGGPPAPYVPDLPNDQIWTSPHFRYASRAGDPDVCSGVVDQLEAHLQAVNGYLGLTWQGGVINYYKFRDNNDLSRNAGCGDFAAGCAFGALDVRSTAALHDHELIHAYMSHLGRPPALFEEGIAEALAPDRWTFAADTEWNWRDILAISRVGHARLDPEIYSAGGWFVSYLLRYFGPGPFLSFYSASGQTANVSATEIATHFKTAYGRELDDVWSEAKTNAPFLPGVPVWGCASAKPMVLDGDASPLAGSCDGTGNFGALELSVPTTFTWADNPDIEFGIADCSRVDGLYTAFSESPGVGTVAFPAGRFYVAPGYTFVHDPAGNPAVGTYTRATVRFLNASGVLGPDCNSLTPLVLTKDSAEDYDVAIANSAVPWFAKPQISEGSSFHLKRLRDYRTLTSYLGMVAMVELCDTCEGPCQIMDSTSEWPVSNGMVLRFTNLNAREGVTVTRLGLSD